MGRGKWRFDKAFTGVQISTKRYVPRTERQPATVNAFTHMVLVENIIGFIARVSEVPHPHPHVSGEQHFTHGDQ